MKTTLQENFNDFEVRCLLNPWAQHCDPEKVGRLWDEAETREDFIKALQADDDLKFGQACGILSKGDFYFIRGLIGDRQFKTVSDAGSVRIQNGGFHVLIPNGHGDGYSRVAVIENRDEWNEEVLNYWSMVEGDFAICSGDCTDLVAKYMSGRYHVYYGDSFVVFVRAD